MTDRETRTILLVEDNSDDVFFMKRALKAAGIVNPLKVVTTGQAAIDYLSGEGPYADRKEHPLPVLILLDLKLPVKNGHEVLEWLRGNPSLATIVAIILSTSRERIDIERAYQLGVNGYLIKPSSPSQLVESMEAVKRYWLEFNETP
jgi:CheY-like chemotaxis protein